MSICSCNLTFIIHKVAVTLTNSPGILRNNLASLFIEIIFFYPHIKGKLFLQIILLFSWFCELVAPAQKSHNKLQIILIRTK